LLSTIRFGHTSSTVLPVIARFAEIREALFKQDRTSDSRRAVRAGLILVVIIALGASFYIWERSRTYEGQSTVASNHSEAAVLNFEDGSELRGAHGDASGQANAGVQHLPRNQLTLTVYLPLGSPADTYDLEMVSSTGDSIWHAQGKGQYPGWANFDSRQRRPPQGTPGRVQVSVSKAR
jgi:hypothetical protein